MIRSKHDYVNALYDRIDCILFTPIQETWIHLVPLYYASSIYITVQ
jgi:hypothetical protein